MHSTTGIFSICMRPMPVKRVGDLWRMNTQQDYVKGQEGLTNWTPRGVSLVHDFINSRKRRQRLAELEAVKAFFSPDALKLYPSDRRVLDSAGIRRSPSQILESLEHNSRSHRESPSCSQHRTSFQWRRRIHSNLSTETCGFSYSCFEVLHHPQRRVLACAIAR